MTLSPAVGVLLSEPRSSLPTLMSWLLPVPPVADVPLAEASASVGVPLVVLPVLLVLLVLLLSRVLVLAGSEVVDVVCATACGDVRGLPCDLRAAAVGVAAGLAPRALLLARMRCNRVAVLLLLLLLLLPVVLLLLFPVLAVLLVAVGLALP